MLSQDEYTALNKKLDKTKTTYLGSDEDKLIFGMEKAGYWSWFGTWIEYKCDKCSAVDVPMLFFDNSSGEYDGVHLCEQCLDEITDMFLGRDKSL